MIKPGWKFYVVRELEEWMYDQVQGKLSRQEERESDVLIDYLTLYGR